MSPGETNSNQTEAETIESLQAEHDNLFNKLSTQRQCFVLAYQECLNATKAAVIAKYSKKTAHVQGPRLVRDSLISALISVSQRLAALRSQISAAWVLAELKVRYEACVKADKHQAATANLNLIGQHLGMFGKGKEGGDLHLHDHKKYVNYPPVPESIQAWVDQMKQVGYEAALPVATEGGDNDTSTTKNVSNRATTKPITSEEEEDETNTFDGSKPMSGSARDSIDSVVDTQQGEEDDGQQQPISTSG